MYPIYIHSRTPPNSNNKDSFRILAMSDMQYDHTFPNKFYEVINNGVIKYINKYGSIQENLALAIIPGDLVESGSKYDQWKDDFFKPAKKLFPYIPVYPVLGNHEMNSDFYFKYFSLPENGSLGYLEHWYYKDYSNLRIIGLNSNPFYRDLWEQLNWLEKLLENTSKDDNIDFVFAQLHHPHKSELWIPGEIKFTGKVIEMLEKFSKESKKPSIHFFGHTHGYSRGQSKNHKHLWVNVASAGRQDR